MSQARRIPRHFIVFSYRNGAPEEESHNRLLVVPDAEQMEFNISAAIQVGHQLAVIGDEFNRVHQGKLEDMLLHLARGMIARVSQTCIWNIFESVMKSLGGLLNSGWTKKIVDYGGWISRLPVKYMCQKWMPAAVVFVALFWWIVSYGMQN
uniref:Uncharacterized protein n=1 Tax=Sphenodon punctatus TaxID=8508 RepID=A0A8D0H1B8_SPHPU